MNLTFNQKSQRRYSTFTTDYRKFLIRGLCGHMTSRFYSRGHGGMCKGCATGDGPKRVIQGRRSSSDLDNRKVYDEVMISTCVDE
jgi:hypothetical protein